ncbi:MAG TPA: hypothetical protein VN845_08135, partial [Solirubrobacteraceae bacterium]|nr:hypothetical protein [Solirubrobacteraceae bacterium]
MSGRIATTVLGNRTVRGVLLLTVLIVVLAPVLVIGATITAFSQSEAQACDTIGEAQAPAGREVAKDGLFAKPLRLRTGEWYEVGATEYGGPSDPSSGSYGSIPDPSESYLPAHPNTFAELSILSTNPANHGAFTFADANALDNLPYMTGLRVAHEGHQEVLYKRDIGYGQGPEQTIGNGEPYRLDVWWQVAQTLGVSKSAVQIQLAPTGGTAATLGEPVTSEETANGEECSGGTSGGSIPLPLVPGTRTQILPNGLAAAGREAPAAVKAMVAAGNRLYGTTYLYGGGHGTSLDELQPAYDCSSAVSYVLHAGGVFGESAWDSTELESYGLPGPGQYVSIYANASHAFMYVGGLRLDTVESP